MHISEGTVQHVVTGFVAFPPPRHPHATNYSSCDIFLQLMQQTSLVFVLLSKDSLRRVKPPALLRY